MELITHTNLNKIKCLTKSNYFGSFIFLLVFCFSFIVAGEQAKANSEIPEYANVVIDINDNTGTNGQSNDDFGQSFIANSEYITGFSTYNITAFTPHQIDISLCKGNYIVNSQYDCYDDGNFCGLNTEITTVNYLQASSSANQWNYWTLGEPIDVVPGDEYYICYSYYGDGSSKYYKIFTNSNYTAGISSVVPTSTTDIATKIYGSAVGLNVEIIDLPINSNSVIIRDEDTPIKSLTKKCYYTTNPCQVNFSYFYDMDGETVSIAYEDGDVFLATTNIDDIGNEWNNTYVNHLMLPAPSPEEQKAYSYELYYERNGTIYKTDPFDIYWYTDQASELTARIAKDSLIQSCLEDISDFNYSECTETENFLTCGLKNGFHYMFGISTTTCLYIVASRDNITEGFPFNIIYETKNQINNSVINNSSTTDTVIAPLKWWNNSSKNYETVGNLLSVNSLKNALSFGDINGMTLYQFYYSWFVRIIWLIVAIYIFFRVIGRHTGINISSQSEDKKNKIKIEKINKVTERFQKTGK